MTLRRIVFLSLMMSTIFATGCIDSSQNHYNESSLESSVLNPVPWNCHWGSDGKLHCDGRVIVLDLEVVVKDLPWPPPEEMEILMEDLDAESIRLQNTLDNTLDHNVILKSIEDVFVMDFNDKFGVDVTRNDIEVCTSVLGALLCR